MDTKQKSVIDRFRHIRLIAAQTFFNVIPVGPEHNILVYFDPAEASVALKLVDAQTNIEVKMLDNLSPEVLKSYAEHQIKLRDWLLDTAQDYPFAVNGSQVSKYREQQTQEDAD